MFWNYIFLMLYTKLNFSNDNESNWLWWLIYLSMIYEHIISIKFGFNSFNATCDFYTKTHSSKTKIFMNWNVRDEWYNGKKKHKVSNKLNNHLLGIKKNNT
jgi:hypothetical protein